MQTVSDPDRLAAALLDLRSGGKRVALVPTMGALHTGHLRLIEEGRRLADRVVASIFVNPLQFGAGEDLDRYPRQETQDAQMLEQAGCDLLWLPTVDQIYPPGFATTISVSGVSERWEGASRPGHFDGVATVVCKLLTSVAPEVALFGEKDFQQLAVIRRMASDLALGTTIVGVPTVRAPDGLALSSRNAYLSDDERAQALALPQALASVRHAICDGSPVEPVLEQARRALADAGFDPIDYFALVDASSLEPLNRPVGTMRLIAAATIGGTRLIDNLAVELPVKS